MRRRRLGFILICLPYLGAVTGAETPPPAPQPSELPLPPQQVVDHVSASIAWYRRMIALQQLRIDPDDLLPRERLYQTALTSLQTAFEFGRAAGNLAGNEASASPNAEANGQRAENQSSSTDQAAARVAARIADLQSQIGSLDQQIKHARGKERTTLQAKRGELSAALNLTQQIQGTIGQIQRFEDSMESFTGASGGLAAQIADLRRSVPELRAAGREVRAGQLSSASRASASAPAGGGPAPGGASAGGGTSSDSTGGTAAAPGPAPGGTPPSATAGGASPTAAANAETFHPESAGVIALVGKWLSLSGSRRTLLDASKQTGGLQKELGGIRDKITGEARNLARESPDVTATDPAQLQQSKQKLEDAARRFRQLSTLLVPLGEQGVTLDTARSVLEQWRDSLSARTATLARYLALRLVILFGSLALVLVISEVWRRATFRYLHDTRRRQQFLALRRVAVGVAVVFVIIFGLVSEVGSLATYAGLITAGLAVALQNVILAVVAYFFLIGRYGVRVGDRVTLAGVTGRVVEIGLIRIYLMELTGPQLRSSGRMVVLSNAVLFQPTALFKQMPGSDFYWHTIKLTLAPTTDVEAAEKRLREAAESVYEKYRPAIEEQHAALQRFIDFQTAMPAPEVYARLIAKGLECTVRYPAEPARAAATDQLMLQAVRQAQAKEPPLEVVDGPVLDTEA